MTTILDLATNAVLPGTVTYNSTNLTLNVNTVPPLLIDSVAIVAGQTVLVKNEATSANRGVYVLTSIVGNDHLFTRSDRNLKDGEALTIRSGTVNGNTIIVLDLSDPFTLGVSGLTTIETGANASGDLNLTGNLTMVNSSNGPPSVGFIMKGASSFIHNLGTNNTALGVIAMDSVTTGARNVAVGTNTLTTLTTGTDNVACGFNTLTLSTSGGGNVAIGSSALAANTTGSTVTAIGFNALAANTVGNNNIAIGPNTLLLNTSGGGNIAIGISALASITTTNGSIAIGNNALQGSTVTGNTCIGNLSALSASTAANCTALGDSTFPLLTTGSTNIAIGSGSGGVLTTGSGNIYIDANAAVAAEATTIRIGTAQTRNFQRGIRGVTTGVADAIAVLIDSAHQLGTVSSALKTKENIKIMGKDSEFIYDLNPVTFTRIANGPDSRRQWGLIAEEVDKVNSNLVARTPEGEIETVFYLDFIPILLNEIIKQNDKNKILEKRIESLEKKK